MKQSVNKWFLYSFASAVVATGCYFNGRLMALKPTTKITSVDKTATTKPQFQKQNNIKMKTTKDDCNTKPDKFIKTGLYKPSINVNHYHFSSTLLNKTQAKLFDHHIDTDFNSYDLAHILMLAKKQNISVEKAAKLYVY